MKNLVITAALVLASLFNAFAMEDGHVLTDLWRRYEDARREDRPQKEAEILSEIKAEALRKHLPVDFYDASTKYVNTVLRRDWKQGDKLREDLEADVKRLNHPLVTFLWMKEWKRASQEELWTFVKEHPKGFEGYNPALYRGVEGFLNGALKPFIRTDREYVLWNLLQARRYASPEQEEIYKVLKEELDGRYPSDGALEYWMLSRKSFSREELPLKRQALQALRSQYAGKALALFPEADWLLMDKEELDLRKAGGKEYKALSEACKRFEWVRKNFTGEEATLAKACTGVEYLLQQLESQDLDVRVEKGRAQVVFADNAENDSAFGIREAHRRRNFARGGTMAEHDHLHVHPEGLDMVHVEVRLRTVHDGNENLETIHGYTRTSIRLPVKPSRDSCSLGFSHIPTYTKSIICSSSASWMRRIIMRFFSLFVAIALKPSTWIVMSGVIATMATMPNA